jgi:dienelactone hydrolase
VLGREEREGVLVVRALVRTEPDIRVPVVLLLPDGRREPVPGLVVADSEGKAHVLETQWAELRRLVGEGVCVAVADARCYGEWSYRADIQRLNGVFFGRPSAAVGAHDLLAVVTWLRGRPEVGRTQVGLLGLGDAGVPALMAAAMDETVACAAAPQVGATYAEGRTEPVASHLVAVGDLPQIAASCAPRPVWVAGATDPGRWRAVNLTVGAEAGVWDWVRRLGTGP